MKKTIGIAAALVLFFTSNIFAQQETDQNKHMFKNQVKQSSKFQGPNWVDENGDGICDNNTNGSVGNKYQGSKAGANKGNKKGGFGDGSNVRPQNGTGLGSGSGTGECDGSGPKGKSNRKGRK